MAKIKIKGGDWVSLCDTSVWFNPAIWFVVDKHGALYIPHASLYLVSPFLKVVFLHKHEINEVPVDCAKSFFNIQL